MSIQHAGSGNALTQVILRTLCEDLRFFSAVNCRKIGFNRRGHGGFHRAAEETEIRALP